MAKAPDPQPIERSELEGVVRETIRRASGLKGSELKKKLPKPYQPHHESALSIVQELAAKGMVHRWAKGKTERFFASDPIESLEAVVFEMLERGPATQADVKQAVKAAAPALADPFPEWWKRAVAAGRLFEQRSSVPRTKLFGAKPDVRLLLKKPLELIRTALPALERKGVGKREIADAVLETLGLSSREAPPRASGSGANGSGADRTAFLDALEELARTNPDGALLSVPELRASARLPKGRFDATALLLAEEGAVTLTYHDHAAALTASERSELVEDERGTYYNGIAFRRTT